MTAVSNTYETSSIPHEPSWAGATPINITDSCGGVNKGTIYDAGKLSGIPDLVGVQALTFVKGSNNRSAHIVGGVKGRTNDGACLGDCIPREASNAETVCRGAWDHPYGV